MSEDFLHYIWKFQLFNHHNLKTTEQESIEVKESGMHNDDAGPDFFNGQVVIGRTTWAGNVEIHLNSSDWYKHKHQKDEQYDKVILHVVWEDDKPVSRINGNLIPTLELKGKVKKTVLDRYKSLNEASVKIPCESYLNEVSGTIFKNQLDRMLVERLKEKSDRIDQILKLSVNDWEQTLYQLLCKYFGFKVNSSPFELLATSLPLPVLRKHQSNLVQLEALLLGQAGFLSESCRGNYVLNLQQEYKFLKSKYQLKPIDKSLWKFMRMRPSNFPTIRLVQLAALFHKQISLFSSFLASKNINEMRKLLKVSASSYWDSHYRPEVPAADNCKRFIGKNSIDMLLINAIIPMLFNYAQKTADQNLKERAISYLEAISPERNKIIRDWEKLGVNCESAYESQALIQLRSRHCNLKKCLTCMVGSSILSRNENGL